MQHTEKLTDDLADDIQEDIADDLNAEQLVEDAIPVHKTREEWLTTAVSLLRPMFIQAGHALPQNIRVSMGFPSTASRSGTVGETWADTASRDKTMEILISPVLDTPGEILPVLVGQLAHAVAGCLNHGTMFRGVVVDMGLEPLTANWKQLRGTPQFAARYAPIVEALGKYPHAALVPTNMRQKQTTRLLKIQCSNCGYTARLTDKWAKRGMPTCVCGSKFSLV